MKIADHKITINAPVETVWAILTNVGRWNVWDKSIETSSLTSKTFGENSEGVFKPVGAPSEMTFSVVNCVANQSFNVISKIPIGNEIVFKHFLEKKGPALTDLTHSIEMTGYTCWIMGELIGGGMKTALAPSMTELKKLSEQGNGENALAAQSSETDRRRNRED